MTAIRRLHLHSKEILESRALRLYGIALLMTNVFSYVFMSRSSAQFLVEGGWPVCWPFFENCGDLRSLPSTFWTSIFYVYLMISIAGVGFLSKKTTGALGLICLAMATLIKGAIHLQDYQFMGNYHYMPYLVTFAFLCVPQRTRVLPLLLIFIYMAAGLLKLNPQWLGGHMMTPPPWASQRLFVLGSTYVVVLELILVWGLLSRRAWLRWATLAQLAAFHVLSFHWVGWFYPSIMACLLSLFPLLWLEPNFSDQASESEFEAALQPFPLSGALTLVAFVIAQAVPFLYEGDPAVTGRGRIFALNMFDARTSCYDTIVLRYRDRTVEASGELPSRYAVRVRCDPLLLLSEVRQLCLREAADETFIDLDVALNSRRADESESRRLIHIRDACRKRATFGLFDNKDWIDL